MRNLSFMVFSVAACIALSACTTGSSNTAIPPTPSNPAPVIASNTSVAGDLGDGALPDLLSVQAQRIGPPGTTYTEIVVSLQFEKLVLGTEIADNSAFGKLPAAGTSCITALSAEYCGQIQIDIDGNAGTGVTPIDCGVNGSYPGADFTVDVGTIDAIGADGEAPIFSNATGALAVKVGEAAISGGGNVVNITIPISAIGGSSGGPFHIGAVLGNNIGPTDCAPRTGYMTDGLGRLPLSLGVPGTQSRTWTRP